jgi:hypothetical protein
MLEAKIKFFDIKKCGYFLRGSETPEFSNLNDALTKLNSWANDGRDIINTTCYEPDSDNNILNTYFCDWQINETNGDSVLILWNEVSNDNGTIYGMEPMQPPGGTSMLSTGFGSTKAIPGFPSYFWFIPQKDLFATVRFNHSVPGKGNLDYYLNGFMANKSSYSVISKKSEIIGYSINGKPNKNSPDIYSRFEAVGRKQNDLAAELIANRHRITRIIRKERLSYTVAEERSTIERVFSNLLSDPLKNTESRDISIDLQFRPTETELRQIINNFTNSEDGAGLSNAGFVYNNGKKVMLMGTAVAFKTELNLSRSTNQIISSQKLLQGLTKSRQALLAPILEPIADEKVANQ